LTKKKKGYSRVNTLSMYYKTTEKKRHRHQKKKQIPVI